MLAGYAFLNSAGGESPPSYRTGSFPPCDDEEADDHDAKTQTYHIKNDARDEHQDSRNGHGEGFSFPLNQPITAMDIRTTAKVARITIQTVSNTGVSTISRAGL